MRIIFSIIFCIGFQSLLFCQNDYIGFDFGLGSTQILPKEISFDTANQTIFRNRLNTSMELTYSHHFTSNYGVDINFLVMNNKYYFFSDSTYNYYKYQYEKIPLTVFRKWGNDDAYISIGVGVAPSYIVNATSKEKLICLFSCNENFINHTDKIKRFNLDYFFNIKFSGYTSKRNIIFFSFNYFENIFSTESIYNDIPFNFRFRNYSVSVGAIVSLR